jgi:hypothetical protein
VGRHSSTSPPYRGWVVVVVAFAAWATVAEVAPSWLDPWLVQAACDRTGCGPVPMGTAGFSTFMLLPAGIILASGAYGRVPPRVFWPVLTLAVIITLPSVGLFPARVVSPLAEDVARHIGGGSFVAGYMRALWWTLIGGVVFAIGQLMTVVMARNPNAVQRYAVAAWSALVAAWALGITTLIVWPAG